MTTPNPHTTKGSTDTVTNVGIKGGDELDELRAAVFIRVCSCNQGCANCTVSRFKEYGLFGICEGCAERFKPALDFVKDTVATANREVLDAVANAIQSSVEHMVLGDGRRDEIVRLTAARAAIQKIREGL